MKIKPIRIKSKSEPTAAQFLSAARAEYMRRCEIFDVLRKAFDDNIELGFYNDGTFICMPADSQNKNAG